MTIGARTAGDLIGWRVGLPACSGMVDPPGTEIGSPPRSRGTRFAMVLGHAVAVCDVEVNGLVAAAGVVVAGWRDD